MVEGDRINGVDVNLAGAAVIDAITDLGRVRGDARVVIVAVARVVGVAVHFFAAEDGLGPLGPETVFIRIHKPLAIDVLIELAIAVVVDFVAAIRGVWVDRDIVIIAVARALGVPVFRLACRQRVCLDPVPVAIGVQVEGDQVNRIGIGDAVAVVVKAIADLIRVRVDLGCIVVAVAVVIDVAVRRATGLEERLGVAVAILVSVEVVPCGVGRTGIDLAVAVVVDVVTDLSRVG